MRSLILLRSIALIRLASPIVLARSGIIAMSTVDMVMVGQYNTDELAFFSIGNSLVMPLVVIGLGLLTGTSVLSANQYGAGNMGQCGAIWRRSLSYAFVIGSLGLLLTMAGEAALVAFGQTDEIAASGGRIMAITGVSLPAFMLILTSAFFLESIKRPVPWMLVMIAANIINGFLNWVMVFGNFGVSAMGAEGAAWATTIVRFITAAVLIAYVLLMREHALFSSRGSLIGQFWPGFQQRRIGYATAISLASETFSFAIISIFAGWLGVLPLAAYGITFNLITMVFMVTLGLGSATSVLVANAHGAGKHAEIALGGWVGLGVNTIVMFGFGLLFLFGADVLAGIFTDDPAMIDIAGPMIAFAALVLIVDGGQGIMISALRGRQDIWIPSIIQIFSYFVIMLPTIYLIAFVFGQNAIGLMEGILIGSGVSVASLIWRFRWLSRGKSMRSPELNSQTVSTVDGTTGAE